MDRCIRCGKPTHNDEHLCQKCALSYILLGYSEKPLPDGGVHVEYYYGPKDIDSLNKEYR